ncbi:MAG TPA: hypothetical protein VK635_24905 [Bradyrhizobium sp.]|jgi:hypothetical protein|nr:hypothetical protein [Bradyrhizobium sp.]
MIPRRLVGRGCQLLLAAGLSLAAVLQAHAQTVPAGKNPDAAEIAAPDANGADAKDADAKDADIENLELDWSLLNVDASTLITTPSKARPATQAAASADMSWSSKDKSNGAAAVSVKQSLSAFLDARVGADMTVVNQPQTLTSSDLLRQKFASDAPPSQSTGTAWAAITAPGLGSIWDKTAVEARVDPSQEQSKLGTSLSKSLPLSEQYSLTLQNGYNVIQQGVVPVPGIPGRPVRNYETDQSAKLSITDTGTSFIAGQTLSSADDRWLHKIGAEQKLFGDISILGSIGETTLGTSNKRLTAGFKRSW